jgi:hypothetical protein
MRAFSLRVGVEKGKEMPPFFRKKAPLARWLCKYQK